MKYTIIGFQQQKLIDMGLNIEDALLLRVIKDMYSSASMEFITIENDRYMWVNQGYLLKQIPILGSRSKLNRKLDDYAIKGLIDKRLLHERNSQRGNYFYMKPTVILDGLQDYDPYIKMTQGLCQNDTRVMSKRQNKDTSIKDTSIIDNKKNSASNNAQPTLKEKVEKHFNEIWELYPEKKGKSSIKYAARKRIYDISIDELTRCIKRYMSEVQKDRQNGFPTLRYVNGSTFFNTRYTDYLDVNYNEVKEITKEKSRYETFGG